MEDNPCCQVIIVDMNERSWRKRAESVNDKEISYTELVRASCLFSAAHTTMHRMNTFCVISSQTSDTKVVYSSNPAFLDWKIELAEILLSGVEPSVDGEVGTLAQSLSLALCGMVLYDTNVFIINVCVFSRE